MLQNAPKQSLRLAYANSASSLLMVVAIGLLVGCAGPTTPFGTPESNELVQVKDKTNKSVKIKIDSRCKDQKNQNSDSPSLSVSILDKRGIPSHAITEFLYNGFDVSMGFIKMAQKVAKPESLEFTIPKVVLKSATKGLFTVSYRSDVLAEPITETIKLLDCQGKVHSSATMTKQHFIGSLDLDKFEATQ